MSDVWSGQSTQWERVGPPLRPSPEDGARMDRVIRGFTAFSVLILGVTPEMTRLAWPAGSQLLAVDKSRDMIDRVWPRKTQDVICGNWIRMPLARGSRDIVFSDGPFGVLRHPEEHGQAVRAIYDVLRPGGTFAFRVFIRPEQREQPQAVYDDVMGGRIGSFHAFKLRLLMAVQRDSAAGVRTGDVWESWSGGGPKPRDLASQRGWPLEQIATIDAYRGQDTLYCFSTLAELRSHFSPSGFMELESATPSYELGERCPTIVLGKPA